MRSLRGLGREAAQPPGRARVLSGLRRFCACELSRCQAIPPQPTVVGMSAVLEIDKLSLRFGGIVALDDVSLSVGASQLMVVVGPNGEIGRASCRERVALAVDDGSRRV